MARPDPPASPSGRWTEIPLYGMPCSWCHRPALLMIVSGSYCVIGHTARGLPLCPPDAIPGQIPDRG
ncbi:hypothetical protein [Crossiella sp. CA198]|uniref:hypothetical protein n=1 Tax=Crossiella sp. CA198 TaxID=3455607 RepID=UPI003F8D3418